jgi:hypothetical protein
LVLVGLIVLWRRIVAGAHWLAVRPRLAMVLLAILPIALRLALLPHYPVPTPSGSDDFSYLLLGDTLRHLRFASPVHPMHEFFESIFVLQEPSYSSIFPLGQGFVLTLGWAGVLITGGAFCALVYWMLRAWTTPIWALLGGLLAVVEFGPLCSWMNDYWGGYLSACAGCLVFGALPRRQGWLLGVGIGIQWLTRPFECVLLVLVVLASRKFPRVALVPIFVALGLSVLQNHAVTKSWTTLPYMESRYQYGVPAGFTFQANPVPHRALTGEQQLDLQAQSDVHDEAGSYWRRLVSRFTFYRFFLLAPLFLTPFALPKRYAWVFGALLLFALGTNFYPYFYPHYIAAVACLFVLVSVAGLAAMNRELARAVVLLCAAHAVLWYGYSATQRAGDSEGRIAVNRRLESAPGRKLVFVRYGAGHGFHEWIHNAADIDGAEVVWAADLGEERNRKLLEYYPDRIAYLVEPDAHPPRLAPYR